MVEPPPSEGDEATITAMSPLAAVGQYMSTNSAKSMFLRNIGSYFLSMRWFSLEEERVMQQSSVSISVSF